MASTNPFPRGNNDTSGIRDSASGRTGPRGAQQPVGRRQKKSGSKKPAGSKRNAIAIFDGWPPFEDLKPTLIFLLLPAALGIAIIVFGGLPKPVLAGFGLIIGIYVASSTFKTVDLTVACILLYLPFAKSFVIPVLPGLNGTNMLIMLAIWTAFLRANREKDKFLVLPGGSAYVVGFAIYTSISAFTVFQHPGGAAVFAEDLLSYKSWLDQFIIYFLLAALIRDKAGAKKALVYTMIGAMAVVLYSVPEMFDKMGRSSIEKSRMIGPQLQSNNFGGFVAYTMLPMIAFFVVFIKDIRAWLFTPYFLIALKVLLTTFSRGAYLAFAAGGLMAVYFRGKGFLGIILVMTTCVLLAFPAAIPDSISDRMASVMGGEADTLRPEEESIDKSSAIRLDMWKAAGKMMVESPILGKGFKGFKLLKSEYLEIDYIVSDPHSMYMYIGSQMGLPALFLFVFLMFFMFKEGRALSINAEDQFIRAAGIGCAAAAVCYGVINIFGSRAIALNFSIYFWAYFLIIQVLKDATDQEAAGVSGAKRKRGALQLQESAVAGQAAGAGASAELDDALLVNSKLENKKRAKSRSGGRVPARGAAAHMAREAERTEIEAEVAAERVKANQQNSTYGYESSNTDSTDGYETRGARKAKAAFETKMGRATRRQGPTKR